MYSDVIYLLEDFCMMFHSPNSSRLSATRDRAVLRKSPRLKSSSSSLHNLSLSCNARVRPSEGALSSVHEPSASLAKVVDVKRRLLRRVPLPEEVGQVPPATRQVLDYPKGDRHRLREQRRREPERAVEEAGGVAEQSGDHVPQAEGDELEHLGEEALGERDDGVVELRPEPVVPHQDGLDCREKDCD